MLVKEVDQRCSVEESSNNRSPASSVSIETGLRPLRSIDQEEPTEGQLLALTRQLLYVDGSPPEGHTDARDLNIIRALTKRGRRPAQIALAIRGLAMMRATGALPARDGEGFRLVGRSEPLSLRMLNGTGHGTRQLFDVALEHARGADGGGISQARTVLQEVYASYGVTDPQQLPGWSRVDASAVLEAATSR